MIAEEKANCTNVTSAASLESKKACSGTPNLDQLLFLPLEVLDVLDVLDVLIISFLQILNDVFSLMLETELLLRSFMHGESA